MKKNGKIFFAGMLISFVASLAPSTIGITAMQIAIQKSPYAGGLFSLGCLTIEIICVGIVLTAMNWIRRRKKLFRLLEFVTIISILLLAISSFVDASKMKVFGNSLFAGSAIHPYLLGLLVNIFNLMHIPFWLGWTTILIEKDILSANKRNYFFYTMGISTGTIGGFAVFIYGGNIIIHQFSNNQYMINWIAGVALLITALVHLYKLYIKYAVRTDRSLQYTADERLTIINSNEIMLRKEIELK